MKRGRPKKFKDGERVAITVRVNKKCIDAAKKIAEKENVAVNDVISRAICEKVYKP